MKITIESTKTIETVEGVPVRLWVGKTDAGTEVEAYIAAIKINDDEPEVGKFVKDLILTAPLKLKPL